MEFLPSFSLLLPRYDAFILDLWGVIHDGSALYPGVRETLGRLRETDKRVVFLSNAPRRAWRVVEILERLGIDTSFYDGVVSSGEAAFVAFSEMPAFSYFFLGPERDAGLLDGLAYRRVEILEDAQLIVNCGPFNDTASAEASDLLLCRALDLGIPMHCINPDRVVVKQDGRRLTCAGALAERYEEMGRNVIWYGKPYESVYRMALKTLNNPPLSRVLAVGDGPETDIKGANAMGIDSALVTGGILKVEMSKQAFDSSAVLKRCRAQNAMPTYLLKAFS
jgi:HAD superfamily hydrolase (TIGR01459 family)